LNEHGAKAVAGAAQRAKFARGDGRSFGSRLCGRNMIGVRNAVLRIVGTQRCNRGTIVDSAVWPIGLQNFSVNSEIKVQSTL
jgi:hypothetical protein